MSEPMLLTAEEIIKLISDEMSHIEAELEEMRAQFETTYIVSEPMNNTMYDGAQQWIRAMQVRHNNLLAYQTIQNIIQAAEEEKRHQEMM